MSVIARVMRRDEESVDDAGFSPTASYRAGGRSSQEYRHACQPLLRGRILRPFIDLFPHRQPIKYAAVAFERDAFDKVEHDVCGLQMTDVKPEPGGVSQVAYNQIRLQHNRPARILLDARDAIDHDLADDDEDDVYRPRACLRDVNRALVEAAHLDPPFALTQSAFRLDRAERSRSSS